MMPLIQNVIAAFKNESVQQIAEFVVLRAKLYAYTVYQCEKKYLKCKGVKKGVANKIIYWYA